MDNRKVIKQNTPLLNQPKEILRTIFSFFNQVDLSRAGATCKQLRALSKEKTFQSLPMPEFNFDEPLSSKTLPGQGASQVADYFQLLGAVLSDSEKTQLSQHPYIYYLLPFSSGVVCFGQDNVTYDYWCDSKRGYISTVLYNKRFYQQASICKLSNNAFLAKDEYGVLSYFYRKADNDIFTCKQLSIVSRANTSIAALMKLSETQFAVAYINDSLAIFQLNGNEVVCEKETELMFISNTFVAAMAGTLDNLILCYSNGEVVQCKMGKNGTQSDIKSQYQMTAVKNTFKLTADIYCVVYASGINVIDFKAGKTLSTLILQDNQRDIWKSIRFVTPIAHGEWLTCSELGKFTLQKLKFHKDQKLDLEQKNDNAISVPRLG